MAGGAWKVAYADFVTALMALFMVLWIVSQDEEIILKTVEYFKDPFGLQEGKGGGGIQDGDSSPKMVKQIIVDLAFLQKMASDYYKKLNVDEDDEKKSIQIEALNDGLKITLFKQSGGPIFVKNTDKFTELGEFVVQNLSWLISKDAFQVRIESHMSKSLDPEDLPYDAWELTTSRSNKVRRALIMQKLPEEKIYQVSGFADSNPLADEIPTSQKNERLEISFVVK